MITLSASEMLLDAANQRHSTHVGHDSSRPLSDGYEFVGLSGEWSFGMATGLMPDLTIKPGGDKGIDFVVGLRFTVDVKTARKAFHLIHEKGKPFAADVYVLAEFDDATGKAQMIGWAMKQELQNSPTRDFGHGVINHHIHRDNLRPMDSLLKRIISFR